MHVTGYGDTGFSGQFTLEVTAVHPVKLYVGMRICQIRFVTPTGNLKDYKKEGHYVKESARGAIASKAHEQFVVKKVMKSESLL